MKFYGDDIWDYEMYDLKQDPNELMNLDGLPQYADQQEALKQELERLISHYNDTTVPKTPQDIYDQEYREQWTKEKINYVM